MYCTRCGNATAEHISCPCLEKKLERVNHPELTRLRSPSLSIRSWDGQKFELEAHRIRKDCCKLLAWMIGFFLIILPTDTIVGSSPMEIIMHLCVGGFLLSFAFYFAYNELLTARFYENEAIRKREVEKAELKKALPKGNMV